MLSSVRTLSIKDKTSRLIREWIVVDTTGKYWGLVHPQERSEGVPSMLTLMLLFTFLFLIPLNVEIPPQTPAKPSAENAATLFRRDFRKPRP